MIPAARIADSYELSPMQKAMLFHALHSPGSATSFNQFNCRITGKLVPALFRQAWQRLIDRQPMLRTSFHWELLEKPLQTVHSRVDLPWTEHDWRELPEAVQRSRWREYLDQDLAAGFVLDRAPLVRCCLARVAEDQYLFNWSHHHILTDGWCLSLMLNEVFSVYGHLAQGIPLDLPLVRPYRDYIEWLQRLDPEPARRFWTCYLEGFKSTTRVAEPIRRGDRFGSAIAQLTSRLTEDLSAQLRSFAARHRITLSTVAQGAWALLLARCAGETDVVFGTTVSGRPADLPGVETMLGMFINTVPVRMKVDPGQLLVPWLKMIQARQAVRSQFEQTPLPDIQRYAETPPGTPLFESNLVFMNYPLDASLGHGTHGLTIDEIRLFQRADVPLDLQVTARACWEIDLGFDPRRFDQAAMSRMLGHYRALLEQFVAEPGRAIGRYSILTGPERRQLVEDFRGPVMSFDASRTIVHRLEEAARTNPDRPAVEYEGRIVSARELNAQANLLARRLLDAADLRQDDRVVIVAPRSEHMVEAILAIWKCGAAYVPVSPECPAELIRNIVEDAQARIVVTMKGMLVPELSAFAPAVCLDEASSEEAGIRDDSNLGLPVLPGSLAYVIYESGSAGKPCGVMVEHAGMLNQLLAKVEELSIGPLTAVAQNASHCFDASVWQFFAAPLGGGRTVILGNDLLDDPMRFLECIESTEIDILEISPSHLTVLLEEVSLRPSSLRRLRYLLVTGGMLSRSRLEAWFSASPAIPARNAYGAVAAAGDVTHQVIPRAPDTAPVTVGKSLRGLSIYITDPQMNLCPIGIEGEICVSGIGVGRGYLNDNVRTKSVFLDDPFLPGSGVRMYRTGDLGCFLPDGSIILSGRRDRQVRIGGHRVEPGEIENALAAIPDVREAAVAAHTDPAGHTWLCAWLVFRHGAMSDSDISAALAPHIPEHMIPAVYVAMDRLPLTLNGKVDRAALAVPDRAWHSAPPLHTPPRTPVETLLCGVFAETLGVETPGIHDNLFALGGDSILSMRMVALAARKGLKITTRQIFQNPTVAELAVVAVPDQAQAKTQTVEGGAPSGPLPLMPIQERFFLQDKEDPNQYYQAVLLEVSADLDPDRLRHALRQAARIHDALRLRFRKEASGWTQRVVPDLDIPVAVHDISAERLGEHVAAAHASLDIGSGPVFCAAIFRLGGDAPARLLFVAHHLTVDGVSWGVLLDEIYSGYMQPALPAATSGASWAAWTRAVFDWVKAGGLNADVAHWNSFAGAGSLDIPADYQPPKGPNTVASSSEIVLELGQSDTTALFTSAAGSHQSRINDILLAALAMTWTGDSTLWIDLETHGRQDVLPDLDISQTVGWFTAIYPVPLRIESGPRDPGTVIASVREQLRKVPNGGISHGFLRDAIEASVPRPQVLFNYLGQTDRLFRSAAEWKPATEPSGSGRGPSQLREHLLTVNCYVANNRLRVVWEFSRNFHCEETVQKLAHNYIVGLRTLISHYEVARAPGLDPSDCHAPWLSQESLDTLSAAIPGGIDDIYPLTPTQQGMLFHSLREPASHSYFDNLSCIIEGDLDTERFRRAWKEVVDRQPVLRTSFHWEGIEEPIQVVHSSIEIPWEVADLRDLPEAESVRLWGDRLADDRNRGFDLSEAPLLRIGLYRIGAHAWRFSLSQHHILLDGWSSALVMSGVIAAYDGVSLPAPPPFREHVLWLRRQDQAAAENFWREKLSGFATPTPLILGRPEMDGIAGTGGYEEAEVLLSADDTHSLIDFARAARVTLNTVAQGAWALLLGRYSGESDVVFGTIVSGRPAWRSDSDRMVGLFISALPVRVHIGESAVAPWMQGLQSNLAQQDEFAYFPLADIQKLSGVPPGVPLFQTLLIFQNYPLGEELEKSHSGLRIRELRVFDPNNYPLTIIVTPGERLSLKALFDDARFDGETVLRVLRHFETLVKSFASAGDRPVTRLPVLAEDEQQRILRSWNDTAFPVPSDKTLVDLIELSAQQRPESIAVRCGSVARTYREISLRSDCIARSLLERTDICKDDRIALLMPRSAVMLETILAIWKCGAAYLPIDPAYPAARIEAILSAARPKIVLSEANIFPEPRNDEPRIESRSQPAGLSYVIFTSGSTGRPKGAMVEHRGMLNHVLAMSRELALGPHSVVAQTASHCSDISVWQLFAALVAGGQTVIYPDHAVLNPAHLINRIDLDGVTAMQFVPSYLSAFLQELDRKDAPGFQKLECLVTIGETLQPAAVSAWFRLYPGVPLMNAYGPTEASDSVAHYTMRTAPGLTSIPLGRPVQNLRIYILDSHGNLCPVGVKGEICVAGVGVGRGYLFDEERTSLVFGEDPFAGEPGVRLYRTGDVGCFSPDGNILFFGRRDFQVKIRGYRIELGDIESALSGLDGIRQAVVVSREEPDGNRTLCGYVSGSGWTPSALREALRDKVPSYMVPDVMTILAELPTTPNGKINRAALPLLHRPAAPGASPAAPRTGSEAALAGIFSEVLSRSPVAIDDNFFDLGGHSLKAILALSRIRRELNREASVADIYAAPTPRALSRRLEGAAPSSADAIPALPAGKWYPASHAQKRIWLAARQSGSSAYNMAGALRVDGELDAVRLTCALDLLVERHESLRTVFAMAEGELKQRILTRAESSFRLENLSPACLGIPGEPENPDKLDEMLQAEAQHPFDLAKGPLFRAKLIRLGAARHVLLLTLHHAVADAFSISLLTRDLGALYDGLDLPPLLIQYRDYSAWHNALLAGPQMQPHRDYWLSVLRAPVRLTLPLDYPRPQSLGQQGRSLDLELSEAQMAALKAVARIHNTSLYTVVLSTICILLLRLTGTEDILIGTVSAGRDREQLEPLVGVFLNPVALRVRLRPADTLEEAIKIVSKASAEALEHAPYPFDLMLEELKIRTSANHTPLFDVQVDYIPDLDEKNDRPVSIIRQQESAAKFDLSFQVVEESRRLRMALIYRTSLFRPETVAAMRDQLVEIQSACLRNRQMRIDSIPLPGRPPAPRRKVHVGLRLNAVVADASASREQ